MKNIFSQQSFLFILITAFIGVVGIGIIIPVVPFIVQQYIHSSNTNLIALHVGLLISVYAFCQFFAAPGLGALSDRFGRRPVLLLCLLGSAVGYTFIGIGGSLFILYLGRIIDGLTGGDISTIFAYIADITEPKDRGQRYGIIGGTIGFGFIIGPTIGGLLAQHSLTTPFFAAAGLCFLNALWGYFVLPESHLPQNRTKSLDLKHLNPFEQLSFAVSISALKTLLIMGFFYMLPFAQLQGNNSVLLKDALHWTPQSIGFMFLVVGVIDIITQGFLSGKLLPKLGEMKSAFLGLSLTVGAYICFALVPFFPSNITAYIGVFLFGFGSGFFEPSFNAMISHTAAPQEQGRVQGANQSMQALSRIIGPLTAAGLYQLGWSMPSIISALLSLVGMYILFANKKKIASPSKVTS